MTRASIASWRSRCCRRDARPPTAQFRERVRAPRPGRGSALNDPNICALYDVGEAPATAATSARRISWSWSTSRERRLAARLARGALPLPEALRIAAEIASALDAAHRQRIIHRDLKPGNVFLVRRTRLIDVDVVYRPELLDFGLAKLAANVSDPLLTAMPTATHADHRAGTILGTFQSMAPEQIEGVDVDARTDIFAFGALLFEMVTGRPAFQGKTQASLFGAILKDEPPPISSAASQSRRRRSTTWFAPASPRILTRAFRAPRCPAAGEVDRRRQQRFGTASHLRRPEDDIASRGCAARNAWRLVASCRRHRLARQIASA